MDVAKSIHRPPIDVAVFFEVFANVTRKAYQNELRLRTVGRLLSVGDGRRLGNWEAKLPEGRDQVWLLPNRCFPEGQVVSRNCLLEAVGDDARILAQEVGALGAGSGSDYLRETGSQSRLDVEQWPGRRSQARLQPSVRRLLVARLSGHGRLSDDLLGLRPPSPDPLVASAS